MHIDQRFRIPAVHSPLRQGLAIRFAELARRREDLAPRREDLPPRGEELPAFRAELTAGREERSSNCTEAVGSREVTIPSVEASRRPDAEKPFAVPAKPDARWASLHHSLFNRSRRSHEHTAS